VVSSAACPAGQAGADAVGQAARPAPVLRSPRFYAGGFFMRARRGPVHHPMHQMRPRCTMPCPPAVPAGMPTRAFQARRTASQPIVRAKLSTISRRLRLPLCPVL